MRKWKVKFAVEFDIDFEMPDGVEEIDLSITEHVRQKLSSRLCRPKTLAVYSHLVPEIYSKS